MELKIGCTGWSYQAWQGPFYPKKLEKKNWLKFYSSIFDVTEINSTFYKIPTKWITKKWFHDTPKDFRFTLKFPRKITHDARLDFDKCHDDYHNFIQNLHPLKSKIAVLILQLPPSLTFDDVQLKLETLLKHLPSFYRYAIEGRNESWFCEETLDFLRNKKLCLVWNEVPMVDNPASITTDFVYLRMIGNRDIPDDTFGKVVRDQTAVLQKWASRVKKLEDNKDIKFAFAMSNNHLEGFSPETANKFRQIMGLKKLEFKDKEQESLF